MIAALAGAAIATVASDASASWIRTSAAGVGSWTSGSNWSDGIVPNSNSDAEIGNSGTAQINSGSNVVQELYLGRNSGQKGTLLLPGGTFQSNFGTYVGYSGSGTFNLSAGTHLIGGNSSSALYVGYNSTGAGTYIMSGGRIPSVSFGEGNEYIGYSGAGTFIQSASKNTRLSGSIFIGENAGSSGYYSLSGTGQIIVPTSTGGLTIGDFGSGRLVQSGGFIQVIPSVYIAANGGSSGTWELSGGDASVDQLFVGLGGAGNIVISGGGFGASNEILYSHAVVNQSGGSHSITNLSLGSGSRYLLSAGTLSVTNLYGSGTMDFTGGSGTISYSGIVDLTAAPLVFPSGVNLSGGSTSLLLLPPGFDPAQFQSLTTQGLYHSVGTPLTIPFGQTVSGVGNLTDHVNIDGTLNASTLSAGLSVTGGGSLGTVYVRDSISGSSGSISISSMVLGQNGEAALFTQSAGTVGIGSLNIGSGSRYALGAGTMIVTSGYSGGTLDFTNSAGTLSLKGILNLGHGTIVNASSALFTGSASTLLIVPEGFDTTATFGSVSTTGMIHTYGTTLDIPAGRWISTVSGTAAGNAVIDDFVQLDGTLDGASLTKGVLVGATGRLNLPGTGSLIVDDTASGNNGGSISFGSLCIGHAGNGRFTQSTGSISTYHVTVGVLPGSNGTLVLNGGTIGTSTVDIRVGQGGAGTVLLNNGTLAGNLYVGDTGSGTLVQTGGQLALFTPLTLGAGTNSAGVYRLAGGNVSAFNFTVGSFGTATFIQEAGVASFANPTFLGFKAGASGTYMISGGTMNADGITAGQIGVGNFVQSGGVVTLSVMTLAESTGSAGTLELDGGAISCNTLQLGQGGRGTLVQTAGTLNASTLTFGSGSLNSCQVSGGVMSLGTLRMAGTTTAPQTFTQSGGTVSVSGSMTMNFGASQYNLQAGVFSASAGTIGITFATTPQQIFNQTGGSASFAGTVKVQRSGTYQLNGGSFNAGTIDLAGGRFTVAPDYPPALHSGALTSSAGGTFDLANGAMAIDSISLSSVRTLLTSGAAGGAWNGPGIQSSSAAHIASDPSQTHKTALGSAQAGSIGMTMLRDLPVGPGSVVVVYTLAGDGNLDGAVNSFDFSALAAHFNQNSEIWIDGDFNYDGVVNALDFNALATNFGSTLPSAALGSLVPEPQVVLAVLAILLPGRRARSSSTLRHGEPSVKLPLDSPLCLDAPFL